MSRFKLLLLPLVVVSLVSCTKPEKGPDTSSGASFFVNSLTGGGTSEIQGSTVWKVPLRAQFTFQACLKSRGSRAELYNQNFVVEIPGSQKVIPVQTNRQGCFNWQEPITYNHFAAKSGWVQIRRDIVGRGVNLGRQSVVIAVNPWALGDKPRDSGDAVVLMSQGDATTIPANLYALKDSAQALGGELQGSAQLLIQDVKLKSSPQNDGAEGVSLLVELDMNPVVRSYNAMGETVYESVKDGDFEISMQVLATDMGDKQKRKVILLDGQLDTSGRSVNGKLRAEFRVRQQRRANQGNLELVMRVAPRSLSARLTLKAFDGLYRFGVGTQVTEGGGTLANTCVSERCSFDKILNESANFQQLVDQRLIRRNDPYVFSNIKLSFLTIGPGESGSQRTVVYMASTCVTNTQTQQRVVNTPMRILYLGGGGGDITQTTDDDGCLTWTGSERHRYYSRERYLEKQVRIVAEAPVLSHTLKFYLNPWDEGADFGHDARELTEGHLKLAGAKGPDAQFVLNRFEYSTQRFLYEVDANLELVVKKSVLVAIEPQVVRYSGIFNSRRVVERLRDGVYLMKVALQKEFLDPRDNAGSQMRVTNGQQVELQNSRALKTTEYISTTTVLVRAVNGIIVQEVQLAMRDLRLMRVRSNFLIQLEPVQEELLKSRLPPLPRGDIVETQDLIRTSLERLRFALENGGDIGAWGSETSVVKPSQPIADNFVLRADLRENLNQVLNFEETEKALALNQPSDLERLVDFQSSLKRRTFVGPVLFLANFSRELMRATDDMSMANCPGQSGLQRLAESVEADKVQRAEERELLGTRSNNAYSSARYFNSLHGVCDAQVDDLIEREKLIRNRPTAASLRTAKHDFSAAFNLDYVSLSDEALIRRTGPSSFPHPVEQISATQLMALAGRIQERETFFDPGADPQTLCQILASRISSDVSKMAPGQQNQFRHQVLRTCLSEGGLAHDLRWHVTKVGAPVYLGGLNLSLGVVEAFSFGRNHSWSSSFDLVEMIGMVANVFPVTSFISTLLKPFSVRKGLSVDESAGTVVNESVPLISQIARFDLPVSEFERCAALRLSDSAVRTLSQRSTSVPVVNLRAALTRGLFICEGATRAQNAPVHVKESYFFVTQSVNESDMIDQTDLYNQPWSLLMRGMRDFSIFLEAIRARETVSLKEMGKAAVGMEDTRKKGWALDKLKTVYQNRFPSFPGFYSVLGEDEPDIDAFTLEQTSQSLSKVDTDPLQEIYRPASTAPTRR